MAGNRKAAEEFILKFVEKIERGKENVEFLKKKFAEMSDKQFEQMIVDIENGDFVLPLYSPNFKKSRITTANNIKVGKELGHEFFKPLRLTDPTTGLVYQTPHKYMVIDWFVRRQNQTISKKMSVSNNDKKVDILTDQATGESKSSSLSFPEIQVLSSLGLEDSIVELIKLRGGDTEAYLKMKRDIIQTGEADLEAIKAVGTKTKSTETLSAILKGMHLQNNL